jgi:hypothetical protein
VEHREPAARAARNPARAAAIRAFAQPGEPPGPATGDPRPPRQGPVTAPRQGPGHSRRAGDPSQPPGR